jgi:hypothetical protein
MLVRRGGKVVGEVRAVEDTFGRIVWDAYAVKWGTDEKKFIGTYTKDIFTESQDSVLTRAIKAVRNCKL